MGVKCWVERGKGLKLKGGECVALNLDAGGSRMDLVIYSFGF